MSSAPNSGVRICYITVPDQLAADSLSNALVKNKLAACVNVIPGIKSTYLWEGKINNDFVRVPHIPFAAVPRRGMHCFAHLTSLGAAARMCYCLLLSYLAPSISCALQPHRALPRNCS